MTQTMIFTVDMQKGEKMRLIDADAIPDEFLEYEFDGKWRGCTIKDLLDSQPTIQPVATDTNVGDKVSRQAAIDACIRVRELRAYDEIEEIKALPSAQSDRMAPMSYEEQLSLDCSFCREHECGDTLYESSSWDGGMGFNYIEDIQFCPICGRELYGYENEERRGK